MHPIDTTHQIEKHILNSSDTSSWLRENFKSAIMRDPVDAVKDAEMLATALRVRWLQTLSTYAVLSPDLTASVLQQHADSLGKIAKKLGREGRHQYFSSFKVEIGNTVVQLHETARNLMCVSANGDTRVNR